MQLLKDYREYKAEQVAYEDFCKMFEALHQGSSLTGTITRLSYEIACLQASMETMRSQIDELNKKSSAPCCEKPSSPPCI